MGLVILMFWINSYIYAYHNKNVHIAGVPVIKT